MNDPSLDDVVRRLDKLPPILLEIDPYVAFVLLGALQLALRHPGMKTLTSAGPVVERVARALHEQLAGHDEEVGRLCERGWHSCFDMPAETGWRR